ncbi:MAG: peptidogalycan biosysnthesis protein, partial [Gammaproteobacteria bacterium]
MKVKLIAGIGEIARADWNGLAGTNYPFLRHEFLSALEQSGAVGEQTGWLPRHLLVYDRDELTAAMPLYLKFHSQGEYVFDHQWAHAYRQQSLAYYPKWLTSIPFTPCQGERIALKKGADAAEIIHAIVSFIQNASEASDIS